MSEAIAHVVEAIEPSLRDSLDSRAATLHLVSAWGPPDLVVLRKTKAGKTPVSQAYRHHVVGADVSSAASVAAYLQSLVSNQESPGWLARGVRIEGGCYCCYNPFRRTDVRVSVTIPGGASVSTVFADQTVSDGVDDEEWIELSVAATVRALLVNYSPPGGPADYRVAVDTFLRLPAFQSVSEEDRFIENVRTVLSKGVLLGSGDPTVPVSMANNLLTDAVTKWLCQRKRFSQLIDLLTPQLETHPELIRTIAMIDYAANKPADAIETLSKAILENPRDGSLLLEQAKLLLKSGLNSHGRRVAVRASELEPTQAESWLVLADAYAHDGIYDMSLAVLNLVPMHPPNLQVFPCYSPVRGVTSPSELSGCVGFFEDLDPALYLLDGSPVHSSGGFGDGPTSGETGLGSGEGRIRTDRELDAALSRLPAAGYAGNLLRAYKLLARVLGGLGWDSLLRVRSRVFIMELEGDDRGGSVGGSVAADDTYDQAHEPSHNQPTHRDDDDDGGLELEGAHCVGGPELSQGGTGDSGRVSEEPAVASETGAGSSFAGDGGRGVGEGVGGGDGEGGARDGGGGGADGSGIKDQAAVVESTAVEAPVAVEAGDVNGQGNRLNNSVASVTIDEAISGGKRLCERWLDDQFQALYDDVCIFSAHFAEGLPDSLSSATYAKLGLLALRLERPAEAEAAFVASVNAGWCHRAWWELLQLYAQSGRCKEALDAADRLLSLYEEKGYAPGFGLVAGCVYDLIGQYGLSHVRSVHAENGAELHAAIANIFQESVRCRITGYDL